MKLDHSNLFLSALLPLLCLDLLLLGLPGMELLVLAFILEMEGRYIAAYLDAYTGPGTATDSLGRYVPKVGTRGMCKKVEQASTAASVSAFAATGFLYDGSPVYGTNEAVTDATLAS